MNKLQLGDYLSFGNAYGGNYILTQIIRVEDSYFLIDVDTFTSEFGTFYSIDEINDIIKNEDHIPYYIDNKNQRLLGYDDVTNEEYKYLIYDNKHEGDNEVAITYDTSNNRYYIMNSTLDEYLYEYGFDFICEAIMKLIEDYKIVKRLRY